MRSGVKNWYKGDDGIPRRALDPDKRICNVHSGGHSGGMTIKRILVIARRNWVDPEVTRGYPCQVYSIRVWDEMRLQMMNSLRLDNLGIGWGSETMGIWWYDQVLPSVVSQTDMYHNCWTFKCQLLTFTVCLWRCHINLITPFWFYLQLQSALVAIWNLSKDESFVVVPDPRPRGDFVL